MEKNTKIVAIYHKDCADGTGAAAILLKKFPEANVFPLQHSPTEEMLAVVREHIDAATSVYTLDCAIGIEEWLTMAGTVITIDHHISVKEKLEILAHEHKHFTYVFDNNRSGASLAWVYFFDEETLPYLVRLIQDFDLWQWKLGEDTQYAAAYLSTIRNNPQEVARLLSEPPDELLIAGKHMAAYAASLIDLYCNDAAPLHLSIGAWSVPAYNVLFFESEIGNRMATKLNQAVALFSIHGDTVKMSFRSRDEHNPSALMLAETLGGGGHRNASGARVSRTNFLSMVVHGDDPGPHFVSKGYNGFQVNS